MIEVSELSFGYESDKHVLKDIEFLVEKNKFCSIFGRSGCGKSTLLRIIAGILPSNNQQYFSGSVSIAGCDVGNYAADHSIGFVFQDFRLLSFLNVRDNVLLPFRSRWFRERNSIPSDSDVDDLLDFLDLGDYAKALPFELSGGMRARTAIARALVAKPSIALLDEPMASLDIGWRLSLYRELAKMKEKFGLTILLVSHDVEEAFSVSDSVIVISQEGSIAEKFAKREGSRDGVEEIKRLLIPDGGCK